MKCLIFKHENAVLVGQNKINAGISKCLVCFLLAVGSSEIRDEEGGRMKLNFLAISEYVLATD